MRQVAAAARGIGAAVRAHPGLLLGVAAGVFALNVLLPPLVLSVVRKPWTYFAFNPWLKSLPRYLLSSAPAGDKLDFLSRVAVFWVTADGPYGAPEWGFAVDAMDLLRFVAMSLLVGTYFALWRLRREERATARRGGPHPTGGVLGAVVGALGLSTGPCSVMGCGAPVLPVVGLVAAGLSSTTLAWLSQLSKLSGAAVLAGLLAGVAYLGWRAGGGPRPRSSP